ncbi:MAG: TonB-dependent receptor [Niabella sp.]
MKFLSIYLFAIVLNVSATGFSQSITLKEKNITYPTLFRLIHKQTGYQVIYKADVFDTKETISITAKNSSVEDVLALVLKNKPVSYTVLEKSIVLKTSVNNKTAALSVKEMVSTPPLVQQVKGIVTDQNGSPLSGVSVLVEGTSKGTVTNDDGSFMIDIKPGESLIFSRIGYKSVTVKPGADASLTIKLVQIENTSDEVIVVGYGKQSKANLTGAVSVINSQQIENRPATNALAALQGLAPGLVVTRNNGQPGREGWDILIRGISSVNGTNSPLVIVDGAPGTISTLNPSDIASISVLKDAAEAAIYGAEAAGGVLIVTTKLGSSKKMTIGYNGLFTNNKAFNIPERNPSWIEAEQLNLARRNAGQSNSWSDQQIKWMQDPDTNYVKNTNGTWGYYENIDFAKMLLKNSTTSNQHDLNISGSTDKTRYLFSMGYYSQNGIFVLGPDSHKRINARMNMTTRLSKVFNFSSKIGYTNLNTLYPIQNTDGDYGMLYQIYQLRTLAPLYLPKDDGSVAGSYDSTKYSNAGGGQVYAQLKDGGYNQNRSHRLDGVFTLKAENILNGLTLTGQYSPRLFVYQNETLTKQLYTWSTATSFSRLNATNNDSKSTGITTTQNLQFLADYDYKINGHQFHLLGGYQYDEYIARSVSATATNIISPELPSLNYLADPVTNPPTIGDNFDSKVLISVFGKLQYNYLSKYLLQLTVRNDASSQLAPGYRSKTFPSVSLGWNIHKEKWFPQFDWLNTAKLRASFGKLGNSSVLGYYDYLQLLNRGSYYPFNNQKANSFYVGSYASPEKGWEVIETKNIGLDMGLFKNRLTTSFDYFVRDNKNMLVTPTVPNIFGLSAAQRNIASMRSWGWELEFKWTDIIGKDFAYWIGGNISDQKNKVTKYLSRSSVGLGINGIIEGYPINTIWGYRTGGLYKDSADILNSVRLNPTKTGPGDVKYLDLDSNNVISVGGSSVVNPGDMALLGENSPHYSVGLNFGAMYKGFDFSAMFQGVLQRKMFLYANAVMPYMESWRQGWVSQNDYWTPDNLNASLPRLYLGGTHNTVASDFWVQKANYFRLKNLQIGYTLPKKLTEKAKISRLRVFFSGQDLWETTGMKFKNYDPEQPNNASFNYPFFRSYAAGINLNF